MSNINADFRVAPVLGRQRAKHSSSCIRPSWTCLSRAVHASSCTASVSTASYITPDSRTSTSDGGHRSSYSYQRTGGCPKSHSEAR